MSYLYAWKHSFYLLLGALRNGKSRPESFRDGFLLKCAHLGSNQGPKDYESSTLTN